jgi:hypothetical protein
MQYLTRKRKGNYLSFITKAPSSSTKDLNRQPKNKKTSMRNKHTLYLFKGTVK